MWPPPPLVSDFDWNLISQTKEKEKVGLGSKITFLFCTISANVLILILRSRMSCSRTHQQDKWLLMDAVATNLQPRSCNHIGTFKLRAQIDARVVSVVFTDENAPCAAANRCKLHTCQICNLIYVRSVLKTTQTDGPDTWGELKQICFAWGTRRFFFFFLLYHKNIICANT